MLYLIQLRTDFGSRDDFWPSASYVFEHSDPHLDASRSLDDMYAGTGVATLEETINLYLRQAGVEGDQYFVTVTALEPIQGTPDLARHVADITIKNLVEEGELNEDATSDAGGVHISTADLVPTPKLGEPISIA